MWTSRDGGLAMSRWEGDDAFLCGVGIAPAGRVVMICRDGKFEVVENRPSNMFAQPVNAADGSSQFVTFDDDGFTQHLRTVPRWFYS